MDRGYFPPGESILREVHGERVVGLLYGQRALAIGALAPLNFVGTRRHSRHFDKPFQRLARTGKAFETIFFGSRAEADRLLAAVERMHGRVEGELPEDAGPFAAGTPYSAFDPQLMLWTVAVIADSAQRFYELFVRRLSDDERERLWADYLRFGELFGMPRDAVPGSYVEFRRWWDGQLDGPGIHLTDEARYVGRSIMFAIPVPATRAPAMALHDLVMLGSLPPRARAAYRLPWSRAHEIAFRGAVAAAKATRPLTPETLLRGPNSESFDLVADRERWMLANGKRVKGALGQPASTATDGGQ
jgi:uncharacterized protein (DUF2236 family)